jgi:hypothetical protein
VFNATVSNISAISWRPGLVVMLSIRFINMVNWMEHPNLHDIQMWLKWAFNSVINSTYHLCKQTLFFHCIVCPSIYGFWLALWYLQTFVVIFYCIFYIQDLYRNTQTSTLGCTIFIFNWWKQTGNQE